MINISGIQTQQYASCVEASKRVRWDIDRDVIRGRNFEMDRKLLPDSISGIQRFKFLDTQEARLLSQIQGRTYANMFGLVERFINCKVLELSQDLCTGDQVALEEQGITGGRHNGIDLHPNGCVPLNVMPRDGVRSGGCSRGSVADGQVR